MKPRRLPFANVSINSKFINSKFKLGCAVSEVVNKYNQEYRDMEENPLVAKALDFSVRIVNLYKCMREERHETVMSKQILRSGTSIGANASEAIAAESTDDFIHKLTISSVPALYSTFRVSTVAPRNRQIRNMTIMPIRQT